MTLDESIDLGFGAMRLSSGEVDEAAALRLIHEALERGVRLFDTADVYAPSAAESGHNERLLAKALGSRRREVLVATKGGLRREAKQWIADGRAKHLRTACEASLRALGVDQIDLYQLHALDAKVPLGTSLRALASLQKQGKIRHVGLCNVRLEDIESALAIVDVASVQVELSPLAQTPLKNGVVELCVKRGIRLIAHSPLGGHRRSRRLSRLPVLQSVAKRHRVSAFEIALAWLRKVDAVVLPIPGATRLDSLVSSVHAHQVSLTDEDLAELDHAMPAGSIVRSPRVAPLVSEDEVVVFVGYPGAGKSTLAESWLARGYTRLNRDIEGGKLADLLPELERLLAAGERRIVLDNTYPRRESRFDVIETARRHGVPVRCVWLETTIEQAQVNAVRRMISRHGRLLEPAEMKSSKVANDFAPEAQFRYRRDLEAPRQEEGFSGMDNLPFAPRAEDGGAGKAVFVDALDALGSRFEVLERYANNGYRIVQLTYRPGSGEREARIDYGGVEIEVYACTHPPGPTVCWCRKPLPGLGAYLIAKYALDPAQCIVVGDSATDRSFAQRLGFRLASSHEFLGSTIEG